MEEEFQKFPTHNDLAWLNQSKKVVYPTANYTVLISDDIVVCSSSITVTLPLASRGGREIYVNKNYVGGAVTVVGSETDIITGGASTTITADYTTKHFKAIAGGYILL